MWNRTVAASALLLFLSSAALAGHDKDDGKDKDHGKDHLKNPALAFETDDESLKWGPCPAFLPEGCAIAVLHGDPSKKGADIFFKIPGRTDIPEHWHTSAERMVLVKGELEVTYQGQPQVTLEEGMYAYGPARVPHKARCDSRSDCILFIAFDDAVDAHSMDEKPEAPARKKVRVKTPARDSGKPQ